MSQSKSATAIANANIALIKYWGKRNIALNLPAVGSISLTLDSLQTKTSVIYSSDLVNDRLSINDDLITGKELDRVQKFMDLIRREYQIDLYAHIKSYNNFPTGAGLASSASAFAALSLAATKAAGTELSPKELSILSRKGSGSAARSVYGGFVEMKLVASSENDEDYAIQLEPAEYWDLRLFILVTSKEKKSIGSTEAMKVCADTSPFYGKWIEHSHHDLEIMRKAIRLKDFELLGTLAEHNAIKMHSVIMSSNPPIIYWNKMTIELMHYIQKLRREGLQVYFTIDAGPQIKVITLPAHMAELKNKFKEFTGIEEIIESKLGPDVRLSEEGT